MPSTSQQAKPVTSDAASEVTFVDNASIYSKADTLTDAPRGFRASMMDRLRNPRGSNNSNNTSASSSTPATQPNPDNKKDPIKNWEARHYANV